VELVLAVLVDSLAAAQAAIDAAAAEQASFDDASDALGPMGPPTVGRTRCVCVCVHQMPWAFPLSAAPGACVC